MIPHDFAGSTNVLSAPPDEPAVADLHICHQLTLDAGHPQVPTRSMQSRWLPTIEEVAALNRGESVVLTIWGTVHPVVSVGVTNPVECEDAG